MRITSMTQLRGQLGKVVKVTRGSQVTFHRVQRSCEIGQCTLVGAETLHVDDQALMFLLIEMPSRAEANAYQD